MILKSARKEKMQRKNVNFKLNDSEIKLMRANAERYTNGNLSAWLRWAAAHAVPKKSDLAEK